MASTTFVKAFENPDHAEESKLVDMKVTLKTFYVQFTGCNVPPPSM